ncbi:helix-turn-helix domain-containing protein [Actinokineospora sp.]|uniref:helix-turn-helix domain-containing protein n=1 Tax=Actinokineospora sp. TaxID=1872133 RepID=UPI00403788D7
MDDRFDLGARIRQLRGRLLSQRELADKAEVSVDLIRKLEQGRRHTASIASLHRIARALDVDVSDLLRKATPLPSGDPESGIVAMRRALTNVDALLGETVGNGEPVHVDEARRAVTYAWGTYWSGKFDQLASVLPQAIVRTRAMQYAAPVVERAEAADLLAQLYQLAGCTLVHLGQPDLAWVALRSALSTAEQGNDQLRMAALGGSLSWLLLTQGRYGESRDLAVRSAGVIEPVGAAPLPQLSVWGSLLLTAATAAGRDRRDADAAELLDVARDTADRVGGDRNDYETAFGVSQVVMQTVDVQVVTERFGDALTTARQMCHDAALPLAARSRHLADVAYAQTRLGHNDRAIDTLLAMEAGAPDWMRHQTLPRQTIAELLVRERPSRLRELATRVGAVTR